MLDWLCPALTPAAPACSLLPRPAPHCSALPCFTAARMALDNSNVQSLQLLLLTRHPLSTTALQQQASLAAMHMSPLGWPHILLEWCSLIFLHGAWSIVCSRTTGHTLRTELGSAGEHNRLLFHAAPDPTHGRGCSGSDSWQPAIGVSVSLLVCPCQGCSAPCSC